MIIGDAFQILPGLKSKSFDMILTDPPYDFTEEQKIFLHRHFVRISRGAVVVFSPPQNQWISPADQYLFWIKPISTKNTTKSYGRFVEMIFVYGRGSWSAKRHWSQRNNIFFDRVDSTELHPFRKPPSLIETLILNHTKEGDTVLDPFAGSGVVAEVCERTGRMSRSYDKENRE